MFKVGVYSDMTAPNYHAIDALSASGAKHLLRSAAHYLAQKERCSRRQRCVSARRFTQ
jgi:hypothetical protein